MILTFTHNDSVRNKFLGSNLSRKVLSQYDFTSFYKILQAILGMSDIFIARLNCINDI